MAAFSPPPLKGLPAPVDSSSGSPPRSLGTRTMSGDSVPDPRATRTVGRAASRTVGRGSPKTPLGPPKDGGSCSGDETLMETWEKAKPMQTRSLRLYNLPSPPQDEKVVEFLGGVV